MKSKDFFKTCFPKKCVVAKVSRDTTMSTNSKSKFLIYNELFKMNGYKYNISSILPDNICKYISEYLTCKC